MGIYRWPSLTHCNFNRRLFREIGCRLCSIYCPLSSKLLLTFSNILDLVISCATEMDSTVNITSYTTYEMASIVWTSIWVTADWLSIWSPDFINPHILILLLVAAETTGRCSRWVDLAHWRGVVCDAVKSIAASASAFSNPLLAARRQIDRLWSWHMITRMHGLLNNYGYTFR